MSTLAEPTKYQRAYRTIVDRVKDGRYSVGSRMPTESELSAQFGVSRVTIRRALDMLVQDGYVESRQGSGYRVVAASPASDTCLTSFTDAMLRAGHEPQSRLLSIKTFAPDHPRVAHLPQSMKAGDVTCVRRLRLVDGTPRMLVETYAPSELLRSARPEDFPENGPGQSILRILSERFNLDWSAACEDISPDAATDEIAGLFGIAPGTPVLRQACSAFSDDGATVFHEDVFRIDTVSFTLSRQARNQRHVT